MSAIVESAPIGRAYLRREEFGLHDAESDMMLASSVPVAHFG
jgi:hypothetical protein